MSNPPERLNQPGSAILKVRRFAKRGRYDQKTVSSILRAGIVCHVAFNQDTRPVSIPMLYWYDSDNLYLHGSRSSRLMNTISGQWVCATGTHLDGLVLARSAFHHSANYLAVCIFGIARQIDGPEARTIQLRAMMERLFPGRWETLRPVRKKEINATRIFAIPLALASAKVREGAPDEDPADVTWPTWGGVIPLISTPGSPLPDKSAAACDAPAPKLAVPVSIGMRGGEWPRYWGNGD